MASDHDHSHQHAHGHGEMSELSDMQLRVRALETILTEKGYVDPAVLDRIVEACETQIGPHNGARIVARAWVDPEFKRRLLEDATEAANSLGFVSPVGSSPDRAREHAANASHGRLHAVLLLSVGSAGTAAGLVQIGALPLARGDRPERACWPISASHCRPRPRSASGTRPPRRGSWCCRCGPRAPRAGARSSSPSLSRATAWSAPDLPKTPAGRRRGGRAMSNTIHDMGGMHGFGPVEAEPNEPVFHENGKAGCCAMQRAMGYTAAVDDRRRPRLARNPAAAHLSRRVLLPALVSRARKAASSRTGWSARTRSRPGKSLRPGTAAEPQADRWPTCRNE